MIELKNGVFGLHGEGFSCLLRINKYGLLELLHFGEALSTEDGEAFLCRPGIGWGSSVLMDENDTESCADAMPLAWSGSGRGDYRESPIEFGGISTDFRCSHSKIINGPVLTESGLPQAKGDCDTLEMVFAQPGAELRLYFTVFRDAIVRRAVLRNTGKENIVLKKFMSSMLDIHGDFEMSTFDGGWIAEMRKHTAPVSENRIVS
ncbi:MAG: hypothetical protein IJA70_10865, partial [Oscillospiraceae bacterium]|nr:hypothetical protein [Oscillospiraceae bacterium]